MSVDASVADARPLVTTRHLFARSEGVVLLTQAVWIFITGLVDKVTPHGQLLLYGIGLLHVVGAMLAMRYGGPFSRGGVWKVVWLGTSLLMAPLMAALVPFGEYGSSPSCVQLCGYPVPLVIFIAFYPWLGLGVQFLRPSVDLLFVALFVLTPLALIGLTHTYVTRDNVASWLVTASIYMLAFLTGRTIGRICRIATAAQVDAGVRAERVAAKRAYRTLHDEIETALDSAFVHQDAGNTDRARQSLERIAGIIRRERTQNMLVEEQVIVANLVGLQVADVEGTIPTIHVQPVGTLTVASGTAALLASSLGALLKNVGRHSGADTLWVDVQIHGEFVTLDVSDNGRGFPAEVLDVPTCSLHDLRERVRQSGGDLVKLDLASAGSHLRVWLPLQPL